MRIMLMMMMMFVVFRGGEKLEFIPASSQLLFSPVLVEVLVDSGVTSCSMRLFMIVFHFYKFFVLLLFF